MPRLVPAIRVKETEPKASLNKDAVYSKCIRMIKGCTSREQLRTTFNFIDLLSLCVPDSIPEEMLIKIREEYNLKEANLFGSIPKRKAGKNSLNIQRKKGILGMNLFKGKKK